MLTTDRDKVCLIIVDARTLHAQTDVDVDVAAAGMNVADHRAGAPLLGDDSADGLAEFRHSCDD